MRLLRQIMEMSACDVTKGTDAFPSCVLVHSPYGSRNLLNDILLVFSLEVSNRELNMLFSRHLKNRHYKEKETHGCLFVVLGAGEAGCT